MAIQCPKCPSRNTKVSHGGMRILCNGCGKYSANPETAAGQALALKRQVEHLQEQVKRLTKEDSELALIRRLIHKIDVKVMNDQPAWVTKAPKLGQKLIHGVPTLFLSDLHFGEVVFANQINGINQYNTSIARARLKRVVEGAVKMLRHTLAPGYFAGIIVALGGDMIEGLIHDELRETCDQTVSQSLLNLLDDLVPILKMLADEFGLVHVPCVAGNHGRYDRKPRMKHGALLNFDWLAYQYLSRSINSDPKYKGRITFQIPEGFECSYRVYNTKYMLTHGDSFKGGDGITGPLMPWMRGNLKTSKAYQAMGLPYDIMVMGHWHQLRYLGGIIVNGSLVGYNEYAQKNHFGFEIPQQALWLTHPQRGLTFQEAVFAEEPRSQEEQPWISVHA